jgi:hypothetical protein
VRHGRRLGKARTRSTGHHLLNCKLLHDLGDVGNPLYSLVVEKTGHGRPSATVQFGRTSTVVGAPSGGALAPKISSAATVQAEGGGFSKRRISVRGSGDAVRQWRAALAKAARYGGKTHGEDLYL